MGNCKHPPISIGDRFARLTVIGEVPKSEWKTASSREYYCRCDCGKEKKIRRSQLVSGRTTSCGCALIDNLKSRRIQDIVGKRFERLLVIDDAPREKWRDNRYREVICQCDCGNIINARLNNLTSGNTKSCGCLEKELITKRHTEKFIGKRFGRLVVVDYEKDYTRPGRNRYICRCDCGNIHKVLGSDLNHGLVKSCGCLRKEISSKKAIDDITGQTFNELTAIRRVEDFIGRGNYRRTKWIFRCSCGREFEALAVNVKHGKTKSCGHFGKSIAEYEISQWLSQHGILFDYEPTFDDLINPSTLYKLKFDFKIYRNNGTFFILEHHGIQHFDSHSWYFGKQQREQTDKIKSDYCKEKGITLYVTFYNEDYIKILQEIIEKESVQYLDKEEMVITDEIY